MYYRLTGGAAQFVYGKDNLIEALGHEILQSLNALRQILTRCNIWR
jgi:hypothetical protein